MRLDVAWQEWMAAGQARLLAARIAGLQQTVKFTEDSRRIADQALARTLAAAERRDLKADELELRRVAAADADGRARVAIRDLAAARQDLNRLLGLSPQEQMELAQQSTPPETALDAAALFERARQ